MLDINLFRKDKGGDPDLVIDSVKRRFKDPILVQQVIDTDNHWRKLTFDVEQMKKTLNILKKDIGQKKQASKGQDKCEEEIKQKDEIDAKIIEMEKLQEEVKVQLDAQVRKVGNLVHESVPVSNKEADNQVVKKWGNLPEHIKVDGKTKGHLHHYQLLAMIDGFDPKRGSKIAGHKGYYLKGPGLLINLALINYGTQFLYKKGYTPVQPPFFMKKEIMQETCQLSDFEESLYKVVGNKNEEFFLNATSEQPISALYRGESLEPQQLPIKYSGLSTCFRKEAGAYGKDIAGIFRVHQFEKVEQFVICAPDKSWQAHEEMIQVAEEFYQTLELPYHIINIVSGDLNDAAAKKYDLEAWFPGYNTYRELVSCSNCTDYQSRSLGIRFGYNQKTVEDKKLYVHMLNATLCATERTLCCILENYQTPDGIKVPTALIPFVGADFFPYTKPIPNQADIVQE